MKFGKYIFLLLLFYSFMPVLAQVDTAWVRRYNGPGNVDDWANALAVDDSGNVYVTGWSIGTVYPDYDYATIKYAPNGDTLWVRRYNGPGNRDDYASALAVDDSGNVYVTGWSIGTVFPNYDYATIKYSPSGDTLWVRRYNGPGGGNDIAYALAVDTSGNVYVTGGSDGDYTTIKYAPNGDTLWVRSYDGLQNEIDQPTALAVDDSGNVYVTGVSYDTITSGDYLTIKYSPSGDTLWTRRYSGTVDDEDIPYAMAIDDNGNCYVTGMVNFSGTTYDITTIKYASNGDTLWVRRYNGPANNWDIGRALAIDSNGNVYVSGSVVNPSYPIRDYATIKYSPNGEFLWDRLYNGPGNDFDDALALAVHGSGNVYVTGYSDGSGSGHDYATIKYVQYTCLAKPGDVTGDGDVLLPDIVAIINFLFKSQPAPSPLCRGDANGNGTVLLPDIIYLINFIFKSGPAPIKSKECCL